MRYFENPFSLPALRPCRLWVTCLPSEETQCCCFQRDFFFSTLHACISQSSKIRESNFQISLADTWVTSTGASILLMPSSLQLAGAQTGVWQQLPSSLVLRPLPGAGCSSVCVRGGAQGCCCSPGWCSGSNWCPLQAAAAGMGWESPKDKSDEQQHCQCGLCLELQHWRGAVLKLEQKTPNVSWQLSLGSYRERSVLCPAQTLCIPTSPWWDSPFSCRIVCLEMIWCGALPPLQQQCWCEAVPALWRLWALLSSVTALCSRLSCSARVKRLGCFDHAQRQLGERCLYVFPDKVEPAKITCECPERNCVLGEGSVAKKVSWGVEGGVDFSKHLWSLWLLKQRSSW